jgi:hypothetical protein
MKTLAGVILFSLFCSKSIAQDTISPIDRYYLPTYNSDFIYFFLRKDSRLKEGLIGYEMDYQKDKIISKSKLFIPLHNSEKWNYNIPIYFDRFQFKSSQENINYESEMRNLFFQSVLNYYPNEKLTFTSIIEGRTRGNEKSHFEEAGNMIAHFFVVKYRFSEKFSVSPAILAGHQWNEKNEFVFFPSIQLKWNPIPNLAFMTGIPGLLGIEWSAPSNFDFVVHSMLDNGLLTINAALRKRFNKYIDLTLRYNRDGYGNTHVPTSLLTTQSQTYSYNQSNQVEELTSVELSFRPTAQILFLLRGGYNLSSALQLSNNDDALVKIDGGSGFYTGFGFYWRFKE